MKNISIITTLNHNVGDDFVREGILYLLKNAYGSFQSTLIHKHLPITVRQEFDWIHRFSIDSLLDKRREGLALQLTEKLDRRLPKVARFDKAACAEILVQSGAPIFWLNKDHNCSDNEWWRPIIKDRWLKYAPTRPFLNIAGGTCQPYHSNGEEFKRKPEVLKYIAELIDVSTLTTVRDSLSKDIAGMAGRTTEVLPCTSIFAVDQLRISSQPGEYIALNYMPGGGHYDFENVIDNLKWEERFKDFALELSKKEPCLMVCHNMKELKAAERIAPNIPRFISDQHGEYLKIFSKAKIGIVNRVHAGFGLASLGKPAAVIGADSRARMTEQIGLQSVFVNDADAKWLWATYHRLDSETRTYPKTIECLKATTLKKYLGLLSGALTR